MLGYVVAEARGESDALLADVAAQLHARGLPLAGAVQVNLVNGPARACDMDLHVLAMGRVVRISQNFGALSKGCRLDPAGLEEAVGLVEAALIAQPQLLIVNKFGKQELDGRGFRPAIGQALAAGIPVLTALNQGNLAGFDDFAQGMGTRLPANLAAVLDWCDEITSDSA